MCSLGIVLDSNLTAEVTNADHEVFSEERLVELRLSPVDAYQAGVVDRVAADGSPYWIREALENSGLLTGVGR
jgi:hypothetical protein